MATYVKEKNLMKFDVDDSGKPYIIDINTGLLYGKSGKNIEWLPPAVAKYIRSLNTFTDNCIAMVAELLRYYGNKRMFNDKECVSTIANYLNKVDRLYSIGYLISNRDVHNLEGIDFAIDHIKHFVSFLNGHSSNNSINLSDFYSCYYRELFLKKHHIDIDEYFTNEMADFLVEYIRRRPEIEQYTKYVYYYFRKGAYEYTNGGFLADKLDKYFDYCKILDLPPEKDIFMRTYVKYAHMYKVNRTFYDNKMLYKNQTKNINALTFEDDRYKVIIPTTSQEFVDEANEQNNCVAWAYMPRVIRGATNVVFIRKKSNLHHSYITCEIYDGYIKQYLLKGNIHPQNKSDIIFREKFQKHLDETWNRV